jgi:acyl-coenzyme A thioesterase PaaI-like protein
MTECVDQVGAYGLFIDEVRTFLDRVTLARLDDDTARALGNELRRWSAILELAEVDPEERAYGHSRGLSGHGQVMTPEYSLDVVGEDRMAGTAKFGTHFIGGRSVAHGGAVPLLLDEAFGRLINDSRRPPSRTAYLHADYRSVVHLNRELALEIWLDRTEGRKHFLRGELRDGDTLCAEGEALFVELRPGQP